MTYYSAFYEKSTPPSFHRAKRDQAAFRKAMLDAAGPVTAHRAFLEVADMIREEWA